MRLSSSKYNRRLIVFILCVLKKIWACVVLPSGVVVSLYTSQQLQCSWEVWEIGKNCHIKCKQAQDVWRQWYSLNVTASKVGFRINFKTLRAHEFQSFELGGKENLKKIKEKDDEWNLEAWILASLMNR